MLPLIGWEGTMKGCLRTSSMAIAPLVRSSMEALYQQLEQGKIQPIYSTLPLYDAAKAHDLLANGKVMGKILLVP